MYIRYSIMVETMIVVGLTNIIDIIIVFYKKNGTLSRGSGTTSEFPCIRGRQTINYSPGGSVYRPARTNFRPLIHPGETMKRVILFFAVLAVFTASAGAQGIGFGVQGDLVNFNFGVAQTKVLLPGAGSSVDFTSLFEQIYGLGYGGGIHFDVDLGLLAFRLSGDYIMLSPDKQKYQSLLGALGLNFTVDGGRIDIYSGNVNLKFNVLPLPVVHVYLTGGAGVVQLKMNDASLLLNGVKLATVKAFDTQTKPTVNAGAGVDIKLGKLALFAELKVNFILTEGKTSSEVPLATVGLTF
jgi:opacity protein-like surface antigen